MKGNLVQRTRGSGASSKEIAVSNFNSNFKRTVLRYLQALTRMKRTGSTDGATANSCFGTYKEHDRVCLELSSSSSEIICQICKAQVTRPSDEWIEDFVRARNPNGRPLTRPVGEHRLIMARKLGRPLLKEEIVHHLDGNERNNEPSNLTIVTSEEHFKLETITCLSKYAVYLRFELDRVEQALKKLT